MAAVGAFAVSVAAVETVAVCRLYSQGDLRIETEPADEMKPGCAKVRIVRGGICGSDLHYYTHGGFGPVRVREPIILGHEIAGVIDQVDDPSGRLKVGDRVAVNPSRPCMACHYCDRAEYQHCLSMRFLGSARTLPHVQGGFRSSLVVPVVQCCPARNGTTSLAALACAEPLAVCLHAAAQAGDLSGKRVLVTGAGPIGALCVAVAKLRGAAFIAITDLFDFTLANASRMGADDIINVSDGAEALAAFTQPTTQFDVAFECSSAPAAIAGAIDCLRPRGRLVQVGVAGDVPIPLNALVGKELAYVGTHRFHAEFGEAARLIDDGQIDVEPMISATYPVGDAVAAFNQALDRSRSVKVQLSFNG